MRRLNIKKLIRNTPNHHRISFDELTRDYQGISLEIGAGTGMHPLHYAKKNPDKFIIAIEKTTERYGKFKRDFEKRNLRNLLPIHAHAMSWVCHNISASSVDEIFILYPNPNPKTKDLNKRWHAMPFFGHLIDILKSGGRILIRTNEKFYADEAKKFMENVWSLSVEMYGFSIEDVDEFKTLFEKKYLERGQICYEIIGFKSI